MEVTLEQVERLREKADVSYAKAKEALEYSGGNLLDALIYLEEQGARRRNRRSRSPSRRRRKRPAGAAFWGGFAISCWTTPWRSGRRIGPSPPCRCSF